MIAAVLATASAAAGCSNSESTYTLYRNSTTDESMRLHVATFDSADGEKYNQGNCDVARELFQRQEAVKTRFWCEKGRFRK
jgi:hypothetical protein